MNIRYFYYAKAHGMTPEQMLEHDQREWPGGMMTGFILWISKMKIAFKKESPKSFLNDAIYDHDAWTAFLKSKVVVVLFAFLLSGCVSVGQQIGLTVVNQLMIDAGRAIDRGMSDGMEQPTKCK